MQQFVLNALIIRSPALLLFSCAVTRSCSCVLHQFGPPAQDGARVLTIRVADRLFSSSDGKHPSSIAPRTPISGAGSGARCGDRSVTSEARERWYPTASHRTAKGSIRSTASWYGRRPEPSLLRTKSLLLLHEEDSSYERKEFCRLH